MSGSKLLLAAFGVLSASLLSAQSQPLAFQVASVTPDKTTRHVEMQVLPGGKLVVTNLPLLFIIATAYNLPFRFNRLSGVPDWVRSVSTRFDIEATPAPGAIPAGTPSKVRQEMVRQMMQTLLAERFKLTVRREMKEQPVYALVVGKNGPKLVKSKLSEKDCQAGPSTFGNPDTCHSMAGGSEAGLHGPRWICRSWRSGCPTGPIFR